MGCLDVWSSLTLQESRLKAQRCGMLGTEQTREVAPGESLGWEVKDGVTD